MTPAAVALGGPAPGPRRALRWTPARRWAAVAAGAALLVAASVLTLPAPRTAAGATPSPSALLARVAASATVAHTGTATSTGALGLPDLPRLTGVAALLGGSTRTRVWWAAQDRWRVDVLSASGEKGTYADDGRLATWDAESLTVTAAAAPTGAHLPRALDLRPDVLARAVVAGPGGVAAAAEDAAALGARRVAGRVVDGVRVRTADPRSTVARVDVWVDRASGLALATDLLDRQGVPVLRSQYDSLTVGAPAARPLVAPFPPGATRERAADDVVAGVDEFSPWRMPEALVGLPALVDPTRPAGDARRAPGVIAYGGGLVRLAALPLPPDLAGRALQAARAAGALDLGAASSAGSAQGEDPAAAQAYARIARSGAQVLSLRSGALSLVFVRGGGGRAWILGGLVTPGLLAQASEQLLDDPPSWRSR